MNPWPQMRARAGDDVLVRVIDLAQGRQCFLHMPRGAETEAYDGATVWSPHPAGALSDQERAELLAQADTAYAEAA